MVGAESRTTEVVDPGDDAAFWFDGKDEVSPTVAGTVVAPLAKLDVFEGPPLAKPYQVSPTKPTASRAPTIILRADPLSTDEPLDDEWARVDSFFFFSKPIGEDFRVGELGFLRLAVAGANISSSGYWPSVNKISLVNRATILD